MTAVPETMPPRGRSRHAFSGGVVLGLGLAFALWMALVSHLQVREFKMQATCINNLLQMQGVKESWALESKARLRDVPSDDAIFGSDKYIREKPECPAGGVYSFRSVRANATCSIPGHEIPFPPPIKLHHFRQQE